MTNPSRDWQEILAPDEDQRFTRYADQLSSLQKEKNHNFGSGRALHRKQLFGIEATLEVLADRPAHACYGS